MSLHDNGLHVLFLPRWYPNRFDPMPGLFIQRHAEAVAEKVHVTVLYTHAIRASKSGEKYEVESEVKESVHTLRVYYRDTRNVFLKMYRFLNAHRLGMRVASENKSRFDLVHVHVLTRLGFLALLYMWKYKTPYIITEHWTRYLNSNAFRNSLHRWVTRLVVRKSALVTTVSDDLTKAMKSHGLDQTNYKVIRNVVAPFFYDLPVVDKMEKVKEFVHVSCFTDRHKNISGLLRVIAKLAEKRNDFHFSLVGEGEDLEQMKQYALELQIPEKSLTFTGLLEGKPLAAVMSAAHALVIFSNYENMPVVMNESLVLGVPVFSTDVGGISEMIHSANGRLIEKGDEKGLFTVLNDFLDEKFHFDHQKISRHARKEFSSETVGSSLVSLYKQVLNEK